MSNGVTPSDMRRGCAAQPVTSDIRTLPYLYRTGRLADPHDRRCALAAQVIPRGISGTDPVGRATLRDRVVSASRG
jgi:hypothetical protein